MLVMTLQVNMSSILTMDYMIVLSCNVHTYNL